MNEADAGPQYVNQDPDITSSYEHERRDRARFVAGLHEVAVWLDQHPTVELPESTITCYAMNDSPEVVALIMRAMGKCEKQASDNGLFYLKKKFGPITLQYIFDRNTVCTAKVVGHKDVPEEVIPARTIAAHSVPILEWDCQPVLKAGE
jgi:hypothetical protein